MTHSSVDIQIAPQSAPTLPCWFAEVALVAQFFTTSGLLETIEQRVRFARPRFGTYETLDFLVVLLGYAISAEPTLQAFYERLTPFASPFMALFNRQNLPHRSTLSRFLAALDQPTVEALRDLFHEHLVARTAQSFPPGGLWDRLGKHWLVIDVDGTKQAARQRALPALAELPAPRRRFEQVAAPAYLGRKRGEVGRTRTTVLQAHSQQWLGTFGGCGNGDYRGEFARACEAIISYAGWLCQPVSSVLVRLDGLYGTLAVLEPCLSCGLGIIVRCKDYALLDLPAVTTRLSQPADQHITHPASGVSRSLFDCPDLALLPEGPRLRLLVATHPTTSTVKPSVGVLRGETVYELFLTTASPAALRCADVLDLYLHRGAFETVLADEDCEQATDRWCSRTPWGQEFWQIMNQWLWNLRLEFGQQLSPTAMRVTEFAPAQPEPTAATSALPQPEPTGGGVAQAPSQLTPQTPAESPGYGPAHPAQPSFRKGFAGADFPPQPDGTLRCPAGHPLTVQERRPGRNGSLRIVYGARITHCRPCPLREQCQGSTTTTTKPRQVSAVLWPLTSAARVLAVSPPVPIVAPFPVLWGDWPRSHLRRHWMGLLRTQTVTLTAGSALLHENREREASSPPVPTRAQRAHWRLSWQERIARNARRPLASPFEVTIHGLPATFAQAFGFTVVPAA